MTHPWGEPEGYASGETPRVRYRILDKAKGEVVERVTGSMYDTGTQRFHLEFDSRDQAFADEMALMVQRCCSYFYSKDGYEPMQGWAESRVADDEVRERIRRLDGGENTREARRSRKARYPLTELPWAQQRALIEQIDRIKHEWSFEWVGEAPPPSPLATSASSQPDYEDWFID